MLLAAGSPGSPQVRALLRAPRCGLGFNLNSLFVLPPAPLPAQVRFLPEPPSVRTALPRAVSCAPLAFHVFFPASGAGAQGLAECPAGFCPARLCPALLSRSLRRDPLDSGIKNCSGRLAEARANPSLRGGAEARRTSQVRSGVSRVRASGQGLRSRRLSRGGGTGLECGSPGVPAMEPLGILRLRLAQSPRPRCPPALAIGKRQRRVRGCRLPQSTAVQVLSLFQDRGKSPLPTPSPRPAVASFRRSLCPLLKEPYRELSF